MIQEEIIYIPKEFQDLAKIRISRNLGNICAFQGHLPKEDITVDWIEFIDLSAPPKDSGFNVSVHEARGGSNIFLG